MAEIHELHRRVMPERMDELMNELMGVLKRHDGTLTQDDAVNILGNLSMVFGGQDQVRAAELLHETFLGLTEFYDLPVIIERARDGTGTMKVAATRPSKPK